jgi:hypothetical protein
MTIPTEKALEAWNKRAHMLAAPYAPSEGWVSCLFKPDEIKLIDAALTEAAQPDKKEE